MSGASIETTLELWASSLRDVKARIRPLFTQERVAGSAGLFLDGLLGDERRKTGWMRAEAAGDPGPWRQQAILGRGRWDADGLRDVVRDYVVEHLAADDAVLVIDETGFLKQGRASCGVSRQYTGSAGKITNCQIGVFAAYVSRHGHAFIDRTLYLPKAWTDDPIRMAAAHVPDGTTFATKPALAVGMIERAIAAGVPFAWGRTTSIAATASARHPTRAAEHADPGVPDGRGGEPEAAGRRLDRASRRQSCNDDTRPSRGSGRSPQCAGRPEPSPSSLTVGRQNEAFFNSPTRQRCQVAPSTLVMAAFSPSCASDVTSFTPRRPRRSMLLRKALQNVSASDGPMCRPTVSRLPSVSAATAIIAATETIRPPSRCLR